MVYVTLEEQSAEAWIAWVLYERVAWERLELSTLRL